MTPDDRITCRQCQNIRETGFCQSAEKLQIHGASRRWQPEPDRPRRCEGFNPSQGETDQRSGLERWPGFKHPAMRLLTNWTPNCNTEKGKKP